MRRCTMCLIRPSTERSNGISSALTTLRRVSYWRRNACEAATSSARYVQVLAPEWAGPFSSKTVLMRSSASDVGRRAKVFLALWRLVGRPLNDFLEQEVHEQEQRLGLEHQQDRLVLGVVIEVLVHAAVLHEHHVAGLPGNVPAVMDVVAASLEHVEAGAVEMAVLLAIGAGRVDLDMRLDRLGDGCVLRADDVLAVLAGPAFPRHVARGIDARGLDQLLVEMAVGTFERAYEGPFLGAAIPALVLLLFLALARLVVAETRGLFVEARHLTHSISRSQPVAFVISPKGRRKQSREVETRHAPRDPGPRRRIRPGAGADLAGARPEPCRVLQG